MSRGIWRSIGTFLFGAALLAPAGAGATEGGVTLTSGWLRLIVHARPAAGYFTLDNATDQPKTLIGAESPACG